LLPLPGCLEHFREVQGIDALVSAIRADALSRSAATDLILRVCEHSPETDPTKYGCLICLVPELLEGLGNLPVDLRSASLLAAGKLCSMTSGLEYVETEDRDAEVNSGSMPLLDSVSQDVVKYIVSLIGYPDESVQCSAVYCLWKLTAIPQKARAHADRERERAPSRGGIPQPRDGYASLSLPVSRGSTRGGSRQETPLCALVCGCLLTSGAIDSCLHVVRTNTPKPVPPGFSLSATFSLALCLLADAALRDPEVKHYCRCDTGLMESICRAYQFDLSLRSTAFSTEENVMAASGHVATKQNPAFTLRKRDLRGSILGMERNHEKQRPSLTSAISGDRCDKGESEPMSLVHRLRGLAVCVWPELVIAAPKDTTLSMPPGGFSLSLKGGAKEETNPDAERDALLAGLLPTDAVLMLALLAHPHAERAHLVSEALRMLGDGVTRQDRAFFDRVLVRSGEAVDRYRDIQTALLSADKIRSEEQELRAYMRLTDDEMAALDSSIGGHSVTRRAIAGTRVRKESRLDASMY
ncbi:hypothetical protein KIPB_004103, partial [Kipferlia bialata]